VASRKAIAAALLAKLIAGGQFPNNGRRDNMPEQAAQPGVNGLFLIKPREKYSFESSDEYGVPPVREQQFHALIYTDVGTDKTAVPADVGDDLLDIIDTALAPSPTDQLMNGGRQTLGGLVYDCRIEGDIELAPGDVQGKGIFMVPIRVILKQYP
jgi:hypothetical protein